MTAEQLIAKGPTPEVEVKAAANATAEAAAPEHKTIEDASTKNVLAAFEKLTDKSEKPDDKDLQKILAEEEKKADDGEDKSEDLQEGDGDGAKNDEGTKKEVAKGEEEKPLPPTARVKSNLTDDLKGVVPDAALPLLKKMSNDAREYFVAEFKRYGKQVEELKSKLSVAEKAQSQNKDGLPSGWYEHEEAYQLTPEYKNLRSAKDQLTSIEEHYRKQLIAIKEGEDWFDLILDSKGNIVQQKRKPGPEADALVSSRITEATLTSRELEKNEIMLRQAFKSNAANHRAGMQKLEDEYFPQYAGEEFAKNEDAQTLQKVLTSYGLQNDRMAGMVTKLYAFALEQTRRVQELEKAGEVTKAKAAAPKNGPTGDEINKGNSNKTLAPDDIPFNPKAFEQYAN